MTESGNAQGALAWQPSLFAARDGHLDLSFDGLIRHQLDETSWVDYVPGWLHEHARLFDELLRTGDWQQRQRHMYDHMVDEPRLVTAWPASTASTASTGSTGSTGSGTTGQAPADLERMRAVLSARYGVEFDSILVNLYRDGRDSVAWHRDTVRKILPEPLVATVSLGARRRFLLRPYGGGGIALRLHPGEGDLVMMGGACQHAWEHTVPKESAKNRLGGARMSITLRHSR